jgi:hypothetical protein
MIGRRDIEDVAASMRERHGCHTAILYGSFARGDATPQSDLDMAGFAPVPKATRIAGRWRGMWLDAFVHPDRVLDEPTAELLALRGGVVLFERDGAGTRFLERLDVLYAQGPGTPPADEVTALRQWAWKMLDRAARADPEGNFRRAWLLTALLEDYFRIRGLWYAGPKQGLAYLHVHEPALSPLFEAALVPGASLAVVAAAIEAAVGSRGDPGEVSV